MIKRLLWLMLMINLVYVVMGVAKYGSQHVDAYGIWMLKAKAWSVLTDERYSYSHQQYPLLLPAMMVGWAEVFGGVESFVWVYPVVYGLVLLVLYRLSGSLVWTTVASFMGPLMAQGGRGHAGLADIWITLLVGLAMLAVRKKSLLWLTVLVAVASQIKMEGIFLMAFFVGISGPWKKKIPWMVVTMVPFVWWQWQVRQWQLPSDIGFYWPGVVGLAERLVVIVGGLIREMLNWRNWYVVWPLWGANVIQKFQNPNFKFQTNIWKILGLMAAGYMGVYLFSTLEPVGYVSSSVDRVMLQLLPLWWVVVIRPWLKQLEPTLDGEFL